jgi:hypothetical protein
MSAKQTKKSEPGAAPASPETCRTVAGGDARPARTAPGTPSSQRTHPGRGAGTAADLEVAQRATLIKAAGENPHAFFSFEECGLIFGFSRRAVSRLSAAGAPVWFRKMNPDMVRQWMAKNPEAAAKASEEEEE